MKLNVPNTYELQDMDFDGLLFYIGRLEMAVGRMLDIANAEGFIQFYEKDLLLHDDGLFTEVAR